MSVNDELALAFLAFGLGFAIASIMQIVRTIRYRRQQKRFRESLRDLSGWRGREDERR